MQATREFERRKQTKGWRAPEENDQLHAPEQIWQPVQIGHWYAKGRRDGASVHSLVARGDVPHGSSKINSLKKLVALYRWYSLRET